jgi:uncharacterized RDD family membrane protein YckC
MKYIVLGKDGKEYGPVDPDTLKKWVEHGRVFKDTQVRNALMKKWNEAGTLDLLQESFAVQQQNEEAEEGVSDKLLGILGFGKANNEEPEEIEVKTAFKQKYVPNPATPGQRIGAFIFDAVICLAFGIILFIIMNISTGTLGLGDFSLGQSTEIANTSESDTIPSPESSKNEDISDTDKDNNNPESITSANSEASDTTNQPNFSDTFTVPEEVKANVPKLNSSFYHYFAIFVAGILLYYGIGLGLFAQTLGMHYWGILIVKGYNDEAFPARTFAFTIGMFAIGIITPIVVLLNPQHRSIHGYLTGTRLIRIAAKPKA